MRWPRRTFATIVDLEYCRRRAMKTYWIIRNRRQEAAGLDEQIVRRLVLVLAQIDPDRLLRQILLGNSEANFLAIARRWIFLKMNFFCRSGITA